VRLKKIGAWLELRLGLGPFIVDTARHAVPREAASWFYVFGSGAFITFLLQIVTGILLAFVYVPSAGEAWNSLQTLNHGITLGWYLRALHGWGSNFMVAIVLLHMAQVFLFGAYKFPRELTWLIGVVLLLATLGMAFTGQIMRFDQDAYWGLGIGVSIASRIPLLGKWIVDAMLGGPIIGGPTLSRFFAMHVFIVPGTLLVLVTVHIFLVVKLGINEWPMPGRIVRRSTYLAEYHALTQRDGEPFVPNAVWKDILFSAAILSSIAACAFIFGPFGPSGEPDPTIIRTTPRPDFFFLWLYAVLSFLPPAWETPVLLIGPLLALGLLFALPFFAGEGEKSWRRRPVAVLSVSLIAVGLGVFTHLGLHTPWSPVMDAWSSLPIPTDRFARASALERHGAIVFQEKQCHNCHALGGLGGKRGPALDRVALRLTEDQLYRQVIQGGGNMPAYGKNLTPAEATAVVSFLATLHPAGQPPARDRSLELAPEEGEGTASAHTNAP
jgi:ubiquinol-cytochrome c reductase cytochrome b subunit